ncbi:hypothetical protein GCM10025880_16210 [Methylorubrum aminovorans]|nr:hypothetical protein GCM10025880_16210 [Methylorubrum aminovorans]
MTGAVGGVLGLATLAVELPVSTTIMLRSIAEIARQEGEDLSDPETALACVQVFALGGRAGAEASVADSGYFAVRAALAKTMSEAARYAAHRSLLDAGAPPLVRLTAQIAARFGLVVSQKVAAQAVPVIGALGAPRSTPPSWTTSSPWAAPTSPCAGSSAPTARRPCTRPISRRRRRSASGERLTATP